MPEGDKSSIVQICFKALPSGKTLVLYVAEQAVTPPRSPASLVPRTASRIAMDYSPPYNQHPRPRPLQLSIVSPAAISRIAGAINALPRFISAWDTCGNSFDGETATLVFQPRGGTPISVDVDPNCLDVRVGRFPFLSDVTNSVWKVVTAIAPPAGYVPFGGGPGAR